MYRNQLNIWEFESVSLTIQTRICWQ